ncbi:MAG: hypothetical protein V4581_02865 [Bacteroidota bacterium]
MDFNYKELERDLERACVDVHRDFNKKFDTEMYMSAGGSKLEAFINDLQKGFENTAFTFLKNNNLERDTEAKKRVFTITKLYAKKCIEDFSKI